LLTLIRVRPTFHFRAPIRVAKNLSQQFSAFSLKQHLHPATMKEANPSSFEEHESNFRQNCNMEKLAKQIVNC